MRYLERLRTGGWSGVAIFLGIALATTLILIVLLRKTSATHLTVGAAMVMLIYLTIGAFMVLASRLFITSRPDKPSR